MSETTTGLICILISIIAVDAFMMFWMYACNASFRHYFGVIGISLLILFVVYQWMANNPQVKEVSYYADIENNLTYKAEFKISIGSLDEKVLGTNREAVLKVRENADIYLYPRVDQFMMKAFEDNINTNSSFNDLKNFCDFLDGSYVDIPGASIKVKFIGLTMVGNRR